MRVLLVAYHYPPDPAVGSLRAGRIADSLVRAGHEVEVLSVQGPDWPEVEDGEGIRVRRLGRAFDLRRALVGLKSFFTRSRNGRGRGYDARDAIDVEGTRSNWTPPEHVPAWRRYIASLLWLPDDKQGWIPSVVSAGRAAIARGIDVVYTTAPPFSAHVAGLALRKMTGVPWVAELRDPWIDNPWKPWFVRSRGTDAVDSWLERTCLKRADRVVAVTASAARQLAERRGEAGAVVLVRNGIPDMPLPSGPDPVRVAGERSVVYVGTLYHRRDPRPFLRALADLRRSARLPPVRVEFIGNCSQYGGEDLESFCTELGIADVVRFVPPVPHAECQSRIQAADLLLLLAQEQPTQVPQKMYEYLATGRPVIAFADENGETAEMLREAGGHHLITATEPAEVAEAVATALRSDVSGGPANARVLREWSADRQMERLVRLLEEVGS